MAACPAKQMAVNKIERALYPALPGRLCRGLRAGGRQRPYQRCFGFTLIEVLVSLVIFALAMAIMSQALFQSSRMLAMVDAGNDRVASQWGGLRGLQEAVANMTVEVNTGTLDGSSLGQRSRRLQGLVGTTEKFTVWTRRYPLQEAGAVRHMSAKLVSQTQVLGQDSALSADANTVQLQVDEVLASGLFAANVAGQGGGSAISSTAAWLPRGTQFIFQDADGQMHDRWPVPGREKELLPRAVLLRSTGMPGTRGTGQTQPYVLAAWPFDGPARTTDYGQGTSFLDLVQETQR